LKASNGEAVMTPPKSHSTATKAMPSLRHSEQPRIFADPTAPAALMHRRQSG
jgi:hypothetical protein